MRSLFSPDNTIMNIIGKIGLGIYLNLLWAICSLPIITAGAATTALFKACRYVISDQGGGVTSVFFSAFKINFKQSTIAWLILLVLGAVLGCDGYVLYHMRFSSTFWTLLTAVFFVALAAFAIILMYIFPLMANYENTIPAMFKNSLMIGMRFLICTVLMAAVYAGMGFLIIQVFTPLIFFGEGVCVLLCSWLLENILKQLDAAESEDADASEISGDDEAGVIDINASVENKDEV